MRGVVKKPQCPACGKPLTLFWDSFRMWNPFNLRCPHCKVAFQNSKKLAWLSVAGFIYGFLIGSGALEASTIFQSSLWFYAFLGCGLGALLVFGHWVWRNMAFELK